MRRSRLITNAIRLFCGHGTYLVGQWVMVAVLARLSGPDGVGQLSLALTITNTLATLITLSGRSLLQTDVGKDAIAFREHFRLRIATNILFSAAMLGAACIYYPDPVYPVILAAIVYKFFENLSDITYGLAQRNHQDDIFTRSLLMRGLSGAIAFVAAYSLFGDLPLSLLVSGGVWALIFFIHDWPKTRPWHGTLGGPVETRRIAALALHALPLGVAVFLNGFSTALPRLVLEHSHGTFALGIFAALAYTTTLGNLLVGSVANTSLTKLAIYWHESNRSEYLRLVAKGVAIVAGFAALGVLAASLFGRELLTLAYGPAFSSYTTEFRHMAMASGILMIGTYINYTLISTKRYYLQLSLVSTNTAVSALACLWLIPAYSIAGAINTIAVLGISMSVSSVLAFLYLWKGKH